jgi:hypothetical protein
LFKMTTLSDKDALAGWNRMPYDDVALRFGTTAMHLYMGCKKNFATTQPVPTMTQPHKIERTLRKLFET